MQTITERSPETDGPSAAAVPPDVDLRGVRKAFPAVRGNDVLLALDGIDLTVDRGEFVAIVGASGCGKSTLLRLVAGFETPTAGTLTSRGKPVTGPGPDRGMVFQDYGLFPWLTVAENVAWGPRERRLPTDEVRERVERFVSLVGLEQFSGHYPAQLSGGMQQRVAIARVLANDPAVLLMDEPFGALDALTRQMMQRELHRIWRELSPAVVFVTHSVEEAVVLADRVVVLSGGPSHGVPGHVRTVVDVELDHPRDVTSAAFNELRRMLLDEVLAEGHED